jgi:hypothetical protein
VGDQRLLVHHGQLPRAVRQLRGLGGDDQPHGATRACQLERDRPHCPFGEPRADLDDELGLVGQSPVGGRVVPQVAVQVGERVQLPLVGIQLNGVVGQHFALVIGQPPPPLGQADVVQNLKT